MKDNVNMCKRQNHAEDKNKVMNLHDRREEYVYKPLSKIVSYMTDLKK